MKYVKLNLKNVDSKGMSVSINDDFALKEITDIKQFPKQKTNYKITLRVTIRDEYKKYQKKITKEFNKNQTLYQAVNIMNAEKVAIRDSLKDGSIQKERITKIKKDSPTTLNEAFDKYIKTKESVLKDKTIKSYKSFYNSWVRNAIGTHYLKDITQDMLQQIVNKILLQRAPRTAKTLKEILSPLFKQYIHAGFIQQNPIELVTFKKFDNTCNPELTDEEIKALYKAIREYPTEPYRSIFVFLGYGRRVNEVLSLKWSDINFAEDTYTIQSDSNKAGKSMTYGLTKELKDILIHMDHNTTYIFHAIKDKTKKMHNDNLKRHWKHILDDAKLGGLRIHDLRHIVGLKLVNAGESLETIAAVLGHTTTSITKRYSKIRTQTATAATDKFMDMLKD